MRFFGETNIDFIGMRRKTFILSATLICIGLISLAIHKGPKFGIDFIEGTLIELHFDPSVSTSELRDALSNVTMDGHRKDFSKSEIQVFGDHRDAIGITEPESHAVIQLYLLCGIVDAYLETGE